MGDFGWLYFLGSVFLCGWYFWYERPLTTSLNDWMREAAHNSDENGNLDDSTSTNDSFLNHSGDAEWDDAPLRTGTMFDNDVLGMPMVDYSTQIPDISSRRW